MMKLKLGKHTAERRVNRLTKKIRIRKTVNGTGERPRLCVFRSSRYIYAQIINDVDGTTIASVTSAKLGDETGKTMATKVGQEIAKQALAKKIKSVVFDRNGFIYHGRVKALADGAREAGLNF